MKKIFIHLILFTALSATASVDPIKQTSAVQAAPSAEAKPLPTPRTQDSSVTPTAKPRNPNRHEQFLFRITQGEVGLLFIGDSITDNWPRHGEWSWLKFAQYHPANFGVGGERTEDVLWRISNGELDGINPKVTVILIGTNNIGHFPDEKPEWVARGIAKIVETVHQKLPNTKVLLLGVFPRDKNGSENREKIKAINELISKMDDGSKTRFLDLGPVFLDPQGEIVRNAMPDLLHPNGLGYELWYSAMHPLLDEMLTGISK